MNDIDKEIIEIINTYGVSVEYGYATIAASKIDLNKGYMLYCIKNNIPTHFINKYDSITDLINEMKLYSSLENWKSLKKN